MNRIISVQLLIIALFIMNSCTEDPIIVKEEIIPEIDTCLKYSIDSSLILFGGESIELIAGPTEEENFNITDSDIDLCKLNQGLGREYFPALYEPSYEPISVFQYNDNMPCILMRDQGEIKIFPYSLLSQHETINEVSNDQPVMIVYCELADLAALYTRVYCGQTFTFAPSGYTYFDDDYWGGVQGILLWDRETESLWWPLNDKSLSGTMQGVDIKKAPVQSWDYITWGEVKQQYPDAIALSHTQDIEIPTNLPNYNQEDLDCN